MSNILKLCYQQICGYLCAYIFIHSFLPKTNDFSLSINRLQKHKEIKKCDYFESHFFIYFQYPILTLKVIKLK